MHGPAPITYTHLTPRVALPAVPSRTVCMAAAAWNGNPMASVREAFAVPGSRFRLRCVSHAVSFTFMEPNTDIHQAAWHTVTAPEPASLTAT